MCSINSLAIKLGNSNCRLAYASMTEWGDLSVNCLNGADEQSATKTMFTIKSNRQYSESFEQCLAGSDESDPVNIIFDSLNVHHSNSTVYMDQEFGNIFAKKESKNGNYKLEFWEDGDRREWIVQFKDIEVIAGILAKLLNLAREQLPNEAPIQQIVITMPSFAKYEYREKILKAAEIIGLASTDIQLMDQITAVAIAYRQKEGDKAQGHVLFFYMGAKSTEFAVFNFLDGQTPELVYSNGFVDFGGENFTVSLVENQMANLKKEEREKWRKMAREEKRGVYRNVRLAMEKIKAQLGCKELTTAKIDLGPTFHGRHFKIERKQFEGSWDNWIGRIPMKYSQLTNSHITVLRLYEPSDKYEFLFEICNDSSENGGNFHLSLSDVYESRQSQHPSKNCLVNVINLNFVKNVGNKNLVVVEYNEKKLKKVIAFEKTMFGMQEKMKKDAKTYQKYMAKYLEIRNALKFSVINEETLSALEEEMDRVQTYRNINIQYFKWKGIEEQNSTLNNSKNAKAIRLELKKHLEEFTASKEKIFSLYKNNFCEGLMAECLKIGLSQRSKEFRELIKMMETEFANNLSIE